MRDVLIRVDEETYEFLSETAEKEDRSRASLVRTLIKKARGSNCVATTSRNKDLKQNP